MFLRSLVFLLALLPLSILGQSPNKNLAYAEILGAGTGLSLHYERILARKNGKGISVQGGLPLLNFLSENNMGFPARLNFVTGVHFFAGSAQGNWRGDLGMSYQFLWEPTPGIEAGKNQGLIWPHAGIRRLPAQNGFYFGFQAGPAWRLGTDVANDILPWLGVSLGQTFGPSEYRPGANHSEKNHRPKSWHWGLTGSIAAVAGVHKPNGNYGGQGGGTNFEVEFNPPSWALSLGGITEYDFSDHWKFRAGGGYNLLRTGYAYDQFSWSLATPDTVFHSFGAVSYTAHRIWIHPEIAFALGKEIKLCFSAGIRLEGNISHQAKTYDNRSFSGTPVQSGRNTAESPAASIRPSGGISVRIPVGNGFIEPFIRGSKSVIPLHQFPEIYQNHLSTGAHFWLK